MVHHVPASNWHITFDVHVLICGCVRLETIVADS